MASFQPRIPQALRAFRVQVLLFVFLGLVSLILFRLVYLSNFEKIPQAVLLSVNPDWLGPPDQLPSSFFVWEQFERNVKETSPIQRLVVTKVDRSKRERVVHPFHLHLTSPNYFDGESARGVRLPIQKADRVYGYLYVHLDPTKLRFFHTLFWILLGLIVSGAGLASVRFRFQQKRIEDFSHQLEEKKRQLTDLEKLALVGQITANILHDLKKPILNIREESRALPEGETKREIEQQVDLFLDMLRDLNLEGFLAGAALKEEFVDIEEVLNQSLRLVKYEMGNVSVNLIVENDTPFILAVKHRLVQLFSNLFLNAFEAMKSRGTLTIHSKRVSRGQSLYAQTEVTDTGEGIPADVVEHIFKPFFTHGKSERSTGLGLYITREIVEELGGMVEVSTNPSVGTTFTVLLPATLDQE